MNLREAYEAWRRARPRGGEACCAYKHFTVQSVVTTDQRGNPSTEYIKIPKPYDEVCTREQKWREYISIRDKVDHRYLGDTLPTYLN